MHLMLGMVAHVCNYSTSKLPWLHSKTLSQKIKKNNNKRMHFASQSEQHS
jgi:hypothetical protein